MKNTNYTDLSEEMKIFLEVGRLVSTQRAVAQRKKKLKRHQVSDISGSITENVLRSHLMSKGLNISNPRVFVNPSWIEIDLLSLKPEVAATNSEYTPEEVDTIIEVKNNAVADQTSVIKKNFDKLNKTTGVERFAVIVLSERVGYKYAIKEENVGYPVFTLLSRNVSAGRWMWSQEETVQVYEKIMSRGKYAGQRALRETGKWEKLIEYLSV